MFTDTHCHLDFEKFDADRSDVLERAWNAGLIRILIPAVDLRSSQRVVKLAESHPNLFAAIGVHPSDSLTWDGQTLSALRELALSQKVAAVGEIGLDYYWDAAPRDHQQMVFSELLVLAAELEVPAVIHLREEADQLEGGCSRNLLDILEKWVLQLTSGNNPISDKPGVLHSFSGSSAVARRAVDLGFYIGVTGPVTFEKALDRQKTIAQLPLDRILLETDAPYLSPAPRRGRRNEPANVVFIADKIAEIHSLTREQVASTTSANADRLFGWGG